MKTLALGLLLLLAGCCTCKPNVPAPLPESPAKGWKIGMLGKGCTLVKVGTHYEKQCASDKPGAKPRMCWVQNEALHCQTMEPYQPMPIEPEDELRWQNANRLEE